MENYDHSNTITWLYPVCLKTARRSPRLMPDAFGTSTALPTNLIWCGIQVCLDHSLRHSLNSLTSLKSSLRLAASACQEQETLNVGFSVEVLKFSHLDSEPVSMSIPVNCLWIKIKNVHMTCKNFHYRTLKALVRISPYIIPKTFLPSAQCFWLQTGVSFYFPAEWNLREGLFFLVMEGKRMRGKRMRFPWKEILATHGSGESTQCSATTISSIQAHEVCISRVAEGFLKDLLTL